MQTAAIKELAKNLLDVAANSKKEVHAKKLTKATEKVVKSISIKEAAKMTMKEVEMA
jgi:hypothetical protein